MILNSEKEQLDAIIGNYNVIADCLWLRQTKTITSRKWKNA